MEINEVSGTIVDSAMAVHTALGPGLLESIYEKCLVRELLLRGIACSSQVHVPIVYRGATIEGALRLELIVESAVIVEVKHVERVEPIHKAQSLTYLKLANKQLGLLLNFNTVH